MKNLCVIVLTVFFASSVFAQLPQRMSYQAVIRNSSNQLVTNHAVGMRISILQSSATGTPVYTEAQTPTTNANGLISIEIGGGTNVTGIFADIDWSAGPYFIKTETDPAGGTNYNIIGTSQLLSVPYALYAKTSESITGTITETDPVYTVSQAVNLTSSDIINLGNLRGVNTGDQDLGNLVVKETGKGLSANDYTTAEKAKLAGIEIGAEVNVNADWNAANGDARILNKPVIPVGTNTGDIQYWNGTSWVMVSHGQPGQYLQLGASNIPSWTGTAYPTIITTAVTSITVTTASSGGNVTSDGGAAVTSKGVCWSTSENPTIADNKTTDGSGTGLYTSSMTGLASGIYYVRAYATNSAGTNYGNEISFTTLVIGGNFQGGKVAYILQVGDPGYSIGKTHGLIAAPDDQSAGIGWWNGGSYSVTGASGTEIGTGNANTNLIVASLGTGSYAAKLCYDLNSGGYSDWYLPSRDELNKLYINRTAIGSFVNNAYWSSSESAFQYSWYQDFQYGPANIYDKGLTFRVRAIRAF